MRKLNLLLILSILVITGCKQKVKEFNIEPPIAGFQTQFIEVEIDPKVDSTYLLENDTKLTIRKGSLLDSLGNEITEPVTFQFRQFDDALSIFLSGLPMDYSSPKREMTLQTAGMFEIRGKYKGSDVRVNPNKPIKVGIGSFYDDPRMGFFKMDDETGRWDLIDIPEAKVNEEVAVLKKKLTTLKPKWKIPLGPEYYTLSYGRMADIFLGDDWGRIRKANMKSMTKKMKGYGVSHLNVPATYKYIKYRGNSYEVSEMLWRTAQPVKVPKWVSKANSWYHNKEENKYYDQLEWKQLNAKEYLLKVTDYASNKKWSVKLEVVTHLRYLVNYTPEQLMAKQNDIEKEIQETEERLKRMRLIEYTVDIYSMGVFNCDRPILFQPGKPMLALKMEDKNIVNEDIHKLTIFNHDLSTYANPTNMEPLSAAFFKGKNKVVLITKSGEIGLFTGQDFMQLDSMKIRNSENIELVMGKIDVKDESELKELLKN